MTVNELKNKLSELNDDAVVIFVEDCGGWTNIELGFSDSSCVSIVSSSNEIFSDDK